MTTDDFDFELTTEETAGPILNLWPLYLHDIGAYATEPEPPNVHGVLSDDPAIRDWAELGATQADWWRKPEVLFPYLFRVSGRPAGFCLVAGGGYVPTAGVDFCVYEFFVAHAFRGRGAGQRAAIEGVARHRGLWEVVTYPTAPRAIAFWRRVLPLCAAGEVSETREDHPFGDKVVFRFRNDARAHR